MADILLKTIDAGYTYHNHDGLVTAVDGVSINVNKGEFIAVLGRNGSGKSTFARLLNSLIIPDRGKVVVLGMDSMDTDNTWEIRKNVGMIFQNPDNQIVGTTVTEDVAFGPENLGVEPAKIVERVEIALRDIGISELRERAPYTLSGGQKQKVAIAGVLAMRPSCIILDESTSMLDPVGRREVLETVKKLNREENITIIHITHHMDEACLADRVYVFNDGKVLSSGTPEQVFSDVEKIESMGLDVPQVTRLMYNLKKAGVVEDAGVITIEETAKRLGALLG